MVWLQVGWIGNWHGKFKFRSFSWPAFNPDLASMSQDCQAAVSQT
jgi:hypothetical protein